jgi:hypothetical protein
MRANIHIQQLIQQFSCCTTYQCRDQSSVCLNQFLNPLPSHQARESDEENDNRQGGTRNLCTVREVLVDEVRKLLNVRLGLPSHCPKPMKQFIPRNSTCMYLSVLTYLYIM